jgi:hypothetical protein
MSTLIRIAPDRNLLNPFNKQLAILSGDVIGYTPLIIGTHVYIYCTPTGYSVVTTEESPLLENALREVNFALFDKAKLYHAILTGDGTLVETFVDPPEETDPDSNTGGPFLQKVQIKPCLPCEVFTLRESYYTHPTGIMFILRSGLTLDFWSLAYRTYMMWQKPLGMPLEKYYVLLLNKYATGEQFPDFFEDVHCDMEAYLNYYMDHRAELYTFKRGLLAYAEETFPEETRQSQLLHFINEPPETILSFLKFK